MLSTIHSIWTIVLLLAFLAIVAWAYSTRRAEKFERAARSVLDDEHAPTEDGEHNNG